jgi:hypothetical protein
MPRHPATERAKANHLKCDHLFKTALHPASNTACRCNTSPDTFLAPIRITDSISHSDDGMADAIAPLPSSTSFSQCRICVPILDCDVIYPFLNISVNWAATAGGQVWGCLRLNKGVSLVQSNRAIILSLQIGR